MRIKPIVRLAIGVLIIIYCALNFSYKKSYFETEYLSQYPSIKVVKDNRRGVIREIWFNDVAFVRLWVSY